MNVVIIFDGANLFQPFNANEQFIDDDKTVVKKLIDTIIVIVYFRWFLPAF